MLNWLSKHVFFPLWEIKDGSHRLRYLRELSASQWWDTETLRRRQRERASQIVEYAYRHCPYYQTRFFEAGFDGVLRDWSDFRRLPLLTKRDIRENGTPMLSSDFQRDELVEAKTGGSTGTALTVYFDQPCQQRRNAAAMRSDRWAGWEIGRKTAAVWGNPSVANTFKAKLRNLLLDRVFYLDTMNVDEDSVCRFVAQWRRERPHILFGHSHSIYVLATYLRNMDVKDLRPRGIISTSMMLLEPERRVIEEVFGCRVTNRYGCEEAGLIACECEEHNGLHLNIDHLYVEFLRDDGTDAAPGEESNIVITDLINLGMPFIRYSIEDIGVFNEQRCPCGRGLPLLERIVGRQADFLKRRDGSLVAGVSLVERTLTSIAGIEQMQFVQEKLDDLCVRIVTDSSFGPAAEQQLRAELGAIFGPETDISIMRADYLERTSAGKFRFAVCKVP